MNETVLKNGLPYFVEKSESMKPYWDGLNENKFMTTKCKKCQTTHFPPTPKLCTSCFGMEMEWIGLPLTGTVETFTLVTAPPAGFSGQYYLAAVKVQDLEKTILGRFIGESIDIGDIVNLYFEKVGDQAVIVFSE